MPIPGGCICSAEGVYIYRGEGVNLSRGGVRLMPPYIYIFDIWEGVGRILGGVSKEVSWI